LLAANELSSNRLVDVEDLSEQELIVLRKYYARLKEKAKKENSLLKSHSIDEHENRDKKSEATEG
jgi:hypothetical protein